MCGVAIVKEIYLFSLNIVYISFVMWPTMTSFSKIWIGYNRAVISNKNLLLFTFSESKVGSAWQDKKKDSAR